MKHSDINLCHHHHHHHHPPLHHHHHHGIKLSVICLCNEVNCSIDFPVSTAKFCTKMIFGNLNAVHTRKSSQNRDKDEKSIEAKKSWCEYNKKLEHRFLSGWDTWTELQMCVLTQKTHYWLFIIHLQPSLDQFHLFFCVFVSFNPNTTTLFKRLMLCNQVYMYETSVYKYEHRFSAPFIHFLHLFFHFCFFRTFHTFRWVADDDTDVYDS